MVFHNTSDSEDWSTIDWGDLEMVIELSFQRLSTEYVCIGYKKMAVFSGSVRSKGIPAQFPNEYISTLITPIVLGVSSSAPAL